MADRKNADEIEFLDFEDISTESKKTSEKADGIELRTLFHLPFPLSFRTVQQS